MNMNQYWRETVCFICGVFLGSGAMLWLMVEVYEGKPKPQPVVVEREIRVPIDLEPLKTGLETHLIRQEAHLVKMQQALVKLSTMNKVQAAQLIEREIVPLPDDKQVRQMAAELGVSRMVVK